jgi:oligopeptide/dipeptide ABC transporter ATP-binding protein
VEGRLPQGTPYLLEVRDLKRYFEVRRQQTSLPWARPDLLRAVDGVSFQLQPAETLGLVGESGCGKSTLARLIVRLEELTSGRIWFEGHEITQLRQAQLKQIRRHMQIIFQDPYSSLNPRKTIYDTVALPLRIHGLTDSRAEEQERVHELLKIVGLGTGFASRFPHELSGGQRRRVGIARALVARPRLLVADEMGSGLDVSIQAQILNLLRSIQYEFRLALIFISHDLSVVRHLTQRIAVMYLGQIVEIGPTNAVFEIPRHPYTRALISAVPVPQPDRRRQKILLSGEPPSPIKIPPGCRFEPRCMLREQMGTAAAICSQVEPPMVEPQANHGVRCHFAELIT